MIQSITIEWAAGKKLEPEILFGETFRIAAIPGVRKLLGKGKFAWFAVERTAGLFDDHAQFVICAIEDYTVFASISISAK